MKDEVGEGGWGGETRRGSGVYEVRKSGLMDVEMSLETDLVS